MKKISLSVKGFFKLASALSSGHLFSGNALAKDIPPPCALYDSTRLYHCCVLLIVNIILLIARD